MPIAADLPASGDPPIVKGEAITIDFTITTTIADISAWNMIFTVRRGNGTVLVSKALTIVSGPSKTCRLSLTHALLLVPAGTYTYDVWRTDVGSETCLRLGKFTLSQGTLYP